ncbi:MAG: glycoside hydrolase family 25 protein [Eubacterium sp.]|nr:glycoside hydrolase family 25 protein [Eubacterium sp.]
MPAKQKKKSPKTKELKPKTLIIAVAIVLVIAVIISAVVIANSSQRPTQTIYDFKKSVAQGIDVSEHNGKIDWESVADEFDFAFIRVGYRGYGNGEILEDKYAKDNLKGAEKAGIPVGVYFYSQAVNDKEAEEEADFVLKIIKHYDLSLPVVIDFEYPTDKEGKRTGRLTDAKLSKKENTEIVNSFCDRVEKKGYISGLYASSSVLKYDFNLKDIRDTVIWAADYNKEVTFDVDYTIWQYSKTGQADGVGSKYVDLDYWYN